MGIKSLTVLLDGSLDCPDLSVVFEFTNSKGIETRELSLRHSEGSTSDHESSKVPTPTHVFQGPTQPNLGTYFSFKLNPESSLTFKVTSGGSEQVSSVEGVRKFAGGYFARAMITSDRSATPQANLFDPAGELWHELEGNKELYEAYESVAVAIRKYAQSAWVDAMPKEVSQKSQPGILALGKVEQKLEPLRSILDEANIPITKFHQTLDLGVRTAKLSVNQLPQVIELFQQMVVSDKDGHEPSAKEGVEEALKSLRDIKVLRATQALDSTKRAELSRSAQVVCWIINGLSRPFGYEFTEPPVGSNLEQ